MSELHDESERPDQYHVSCPSCGVGHDQMRMHSHLRRSHVRAVEGIEWSDETQIQCNNCGNIRVFEE